VDNGSKCGEDECDGHSTMKVVLHIRVVLYLGTYGGVGTSMQVII
jgi:hypothetical protein